MLADYMRHNIGNLLKPQHGKHAEEPVQESSQPELQAEPSGQGQGQAKASAFHFVAVGSLPNVAFDAHPLSVRLLLQLFPCCNTHNAAVVLMPQYTLCCNACAPDAATVLMLQYF